MCPVSVLLQSKLEKLIFFSYILLTQISPLVFDKDSFFRFETGIHDCHSEGTMSQFFLDQGLSFNFM